MYRCVTAVVAKSGLTIIGIKNRQHAPRKDLYSFENFVISSQSFEIKDVGNKMYVRMMCLSQRI